MRYLIPVKKVKFHYLLAEVVEGMFSLYALFLSCQDVSHFLY